MKNKVLITDIQRFSIHDGPGIRTTIFFKGCPLLCSWCHNPETINFRNELVYTVNDCLLCGDCLKACTEKAITIDGKSLSINRNVCNLCFQCTEVCPSGALLPAANQFDNKMLVSEVLKDISWYKDGGGITLSGGEPLVQYAFLKEFLPMAKANGLHIAVETCGYWNYNLIEDILEMIDLFLFDIKLIDEKRHIQYIGKSNKTIIANLTALIKARRSVQLRMPVIPDINNDDNNLAKTCELIKSLKLDSIVLLPYHNFGEGKLLKIDSPLKPLNKDSLSEKDLEKVKDFFKTSCIEPLLT